MTNDLIEWSAIEHQIAEAKDIETLSALSDRLEAIRVMARQSRQSLQVQNRIAEYRLRVERKKGEWLKTNIQHEGAALSGWKNASIASRRLADIGLSWDESSKAQKIAELPQDKFEEYIQEAKATNQEVTLSGVVKAAKQLFREEKIADQVERLNSQPLDLPSGAFDVIVIDPPWHYGDTYNPDTRRGTIPYPSLQQPQLLQLTIPAKDDCVLWLWTTNTHIRDAFELLEAWGFAPKTILTWDKVNLGTGYYLRSQTEHCLLAIKGSPVWTNKTYTTLIRETRTEHSTKPEAFYQMVEEICPGRKLDYFARKPRIGWSVFGDEVQI